PRALYLFFFCTDTATTEIYTLSLHDALPIFGSSGIGTATTLGRQIESMLANDQNSVFDASVFLNFPGDIPTYIGFPTRFQNLDADRKSTRLNSSHLGISYAVFCLKKKKIYSI